MKKASTLTLFLGLLSILLLVGCSKKEGTPDEPGSGGEAQTKKHAHAEGAGHGPHDGVLARLTDGSGFVELKLHDDRGDLELWIASDGKITKPIDLPLDGVVKVTFTEREGRVVELRVRNITHNEDENGAPNIRDGKTNYFIFPGETGSSADWLKGKGFKSSAVVSFDLGGKPVVSEPLTLVPHHHEH